MLKPLGYLYNQTRRYYRYKAGTTDNDNSQTDKTGPFSGLKFAKIKFPLNSTERYEYAFNAFRRP